MFSSTIAHLLLANPNIRYRREADDKSEELSPDNNERYIESLVVVDQKMCNYYGEDAATQFTMAVLNMVRHHALLFRHKIQIFPSQFNFILLES